MSVAADRTQVPLPALEELLRRALDATGAPVGWISFVEEGFERLHARSGVTFTELPPERSLLLSSALREPAIVRDAAETRWEAHPLVAAGPRARFVAVVPFIDGGGAVIGSLTVLDPLPRNLKRTQGTALLNIASLAVARVEATRAAIAASRHALAAPPLSPTGASAGTASDAAIDGALSQALAEHLDGAFFLADASGALVRWNAAFAMAVGIAADAPRPRLHLLDIVSPHERLVVERALREVIDGGRGIAIEAELVDRAGNVRPYSLAGSPLRVAGGCWMIGVARDITLRRRAEQQMVRAKERLDLALRSSSLALWDWDLASDRVYLNENWTSLLGEPPRETTYSVQEMLEATHGDDRGLLRAAIGNAVRGVSDDFDCEYRVANREGAWIWIHARGRVTQRDAAGRAVRMTGTSTDITKRKLAEERAERLATRDPLTGLPNRVLLHDRLEQAVINAARHRSGFGFMFIDLDRFKTINDSLGHQVGDELLKSVAQRLTDCVRASDTVARLGGDEFAVILENLRGDDDEGAQQVAEKMIAAMAMPLVVGGQPLSTSCSIGISLYPADGRDGATLMKNADVAMYYAKEKGRNNYRFFAEDMNARAQDRLAVESFLRLALRRNELVLHYQPRMRVSDGALLGVEALIRWQHPRRGLLEPSQFIEVAEDSGLIVPIGEWVIEAACAQLKAWQERIDGNLRLSVNLAVGQVSDGDRLFRAVEAAVQRHGVRPSTLELELTESQLMKNIQEKATLLHRLGDLGVGLAIDDFGTGYSSLSYLKQLPVDAIKIDGSFVRDMEDDPNDEAIIQAILAMAHSLGLSVVAEGVENAAQLAALRQLGCDEYQGFLESAALTAADFEKRYASR
ncbi:MAG TPA: EAL domain-containing protein [Usitatibacter sp.]|nr:EAL domain-containing protein [Usitatibacter sp.]